MLSNGVVKFNLINKYEAKMYINNNKMKKLKSNLKICFIFIRK